MKSTGSACEPPTVMIAMIVTRGVAVVVAALSEKSKIAGVPVSAAMSTANDVSAERFGRWWWCWRRRRRSTTCGPTMLTGYTKTIALLGVLAVLCALLGTVDAAAKTRPDEPRAKGHKDAEPVIEEVNAKQLERLLNEKDFVAVYWYARSCTTCDKVLAELEKIDDDTDHFGVDFVKINDKRLAKQYGIKNFPALTYFREKEPIIYEGDLMDEENVLDFLTSLEAMDLPDRIEEVNAKILQKIVEDTEFVAVLFCPDTQRCAGVGSNKPDCKKCLKALQELENIDDEADQLGIGFVKIADEQLADEYNLGPLPKLVYYRHQIPIIYEHELSREEDVLEWLVANKSTGDEEDVIEDVTSKTLHTLIGNIDNLVVVFYDNGDEDSMQVLTELEKIDDDCDKHGIQFVKIDDEKAAKDFGIDSVPAIVYFEKQIPNVYDGDVENEDEILEWLLAQLEKDEIEDVTDEMLDRLIKDGKTLAVLFYDNNDRKSQKILNELENIDDECDQLGVTFVKIDNADEAKEYGVEKMPSMLYFEKGIPTLYEGNLEDEEKVLKWLEQRQKSDQIEDITDEVLDMIIEKMPHVAVLFYDKDQKKSQKILAELENIDDDCDQHNIAFVKISDLEEGKEYGIDSFPTLVLFERRIPHVYEGDLMNEDQLLGWLLHQKKHTEIPEVTDEMMEKLIETSPYLAVLFYDKDDKQDIRILNELENIDDELEKEGIVIIRMDNDAEAKEYGIDHLPTLVYFENKIPAIYEGDLLNEDEVLEWLIEQKNTATIEEVTDEILTDLIEEHEYVVAFFSGDCEEGDECDKVLEQLENIDDELDETGIIFVTTEDTGFAKKHGIKSFPTLAFFRNKDPLIFKGDLEDEDEVLSWITDEDTLEIPGKIEEVNGKMLESILEENDYVVVFFYKEGDKKSQKILQELENIDDECEEKDIDFVKISDEGIEKEYDLPGLPALAFYRHKFRQVYNGDMMHEEAILEWILDLRTQTPDVIENVDRKTLQVLINDVEHLAVFFYDDKCEACPEILEELETIDDDTDKHGIQFVKSNDAKLAAEIGVFSFPALVYYETGVPIMYDGNLLDETEVLDWMVKQKTDESIEEIDRDTLTKYIETKEFLAVVFYKEEDPESPRVLRHVELIDDEAAEYGIKIVRMKDRLMAKKYGFRNPPGITYFRKGKNINYDGDIDDEEEILDWLTNPENMELTDHIERINKKMFHKIRQTTDYLAVFFYSNDCKQCGRVLAEIEHIDDEADGAGIKFVKIDDKQLSKQYGVFALPAILFFKMSSKEPVIYAGDLYDEEQILQWLMTQKDPSGEVIEDLEGEDLLNLIRESESLAVYFWNRTLCELCQAKNQRKQGRHKERRIVEHEAAEELDDVEDCEQCMGILEELENIDDDCDRHGITFVKTNDYKVAEDYGVTDFPVLVYFENQIPNVFEGELAVEEEVLQWLITQKTEDRIELITRVMLETSVEETQYLAVYFYKQNCRICDEILEGLERVDDECDVFGIHMVKIQDPQLAKRYSIKTFPALVYFRNGNPLLFEGDLQNEESVLEWLIDDDNRELADEIEAVNDRMLERLLDESPFLAVFFYDEDCPECDEIMEALEKIDGEADLFGIDFVKVFSPEAAEKYGILNVPSLVYFRKKTPLLYDGDLTQEDKILQWLTSQDVFEIKNEIEEVNKKMLDKLLDENEFLAVFFYEHDNKESEEVNEKLEDIDGETDNLDITFVKMADPRYARKWGVTKLPAIVYFRKRFPSIYRGNIHNEQDVLEWLRKNRYRQPELNIYMYMLIAITILFTMYTGFLLSCFRSQPAAAVAHPKQA
ncbi:hulk isoform X1 [Lasioglossum baleicum]|uniref:hulk isoform X1 n=1 Tax=Lasioglossum baleicum TaxID=434251 RepID=UPI003FCDA05B